MSEAREGRARDRKSRRADAARAKKSLAAAIRRERSRLRLRHRVLFGLGLGCASKRLIELTDTYARRHALRLVHRLLGDDLCPTHLRRIAVSRITRPLEERTHPPIDTARSARSVLHLVEGVVVGGDAGVVHLLEAHDDGVAHAGLVDGDDLAVVVEPVRLGAEDLHLRYYKTTDEKTRTEGPTKVSERFALARSRTRSSARWVWPGARGGGGRRERDSRVGGRREAGGGSDRIGVRFRLSQSSIFPGGGPIAVGSAALRPIGASRSFGASGTRRSGRPRRWLGSMSRGGGSGSRRTLAPRGGPMGSGLGSAGFSAFFSGAASPCARDGDAGGRGVGSG